MSRNKKTGRAKHYAFLEFKTSEVAQIAAEAMDGYMLFTQKLDCHVLPTSQLHKDLFKGANRTFKRIPWRKIEAQRHDRVRTDEQQVLPNAHMLDCPWIRLAVPDDSQLLHISQNKFEIGLQILSLMTVMSLLTMLIIAHGDKSIFHIVEQFLI